MSNKIITIRIFEKDMGGDILLLNQFILHAASKKGNRTSYIKASKPDITLLL